MQCDYYNANTCRSCTLLPTPYPQQVRLREKAAQLALQPHTTHLQWLPPATSAAVGFRNKAKLAVGGSADNPTFGILDQNGLGVDLTRCGLYEPNLAQVLPALTSAVRELQLEPYHLKTRRGELKYLLITCSPDGALMVRFVLRSTALLARLQSKVTQLTNRVPQLHVVSANIQPEHKAILEGDREIPLTRQQYLPMRVNDLTLNLLPRSFFQTNTKIAEVLYQQITDWANRFQPRLVWDLYSGVGGFAMHLAAPDRQVIGVELTEEATLSAVQSSTALPPAAKENLIFHTADATAYAQLALASPHATDQQPDLIVVNPPRRGIGFELAQAINNSRCETVLYSSCNPQSLAKDLSVMTEFMAKEARLFDMFPHTHHQEIAVLLRRK